MRTRDIMLAAGAALVLATTVGCGAREQPGEPQVAGSSTEAEAVVKTMDEYRAEAARDISAEDAEAELARLQKELAADLEAGE